MSGRTPRALNSLFVEEARVEVADFRASLTFGARATRREWANRQFGRRRGCRRCRIGLSSGLVVVRSIRHDVLVEIVLWSYGFERAVGEAGSQGWVVTRESLPRGLRIAVVVSRRPAPTRLPGRRPAGGRGLRLSNRSATVVSGIFP